MTYCFAWKYQDAAFLIADTLATQGSPAPANHPVTSMGEPHIQLGDDFVEEWLLKIRDLGNGIAVAYAGDVQLGLTIIDFIQDHIKTVVKASDLLPMVSVSMGPFNSDHYVELLVVQGMENGECSITKWNTLGHQEEATYHAYIGSMPPDQAKRMAELFQRLIAGETPSKDAMLLAGMGFVESLSIHDTIIRYYVGGVVCGLRVQRATTVWPDDLMILQHTGDLSSLPGRISMHVREGVVCINSTHLGPIGSIFVNKHAGVSTDQLMKRWDEEWLPYIKDYMSKHFVTCTRWIFINVDQPIFLSFVVHLDLKHAGHLLRIMHRDDGNIDFQFGSDLLAILRRELPTPGGPELRILDAADPSAPSPDGMP